jgi:hypothetical protein
MSEFFTLQRDGGLVVDLREVRWWVTLYVLDLLQLLGPAPEVPEDPLAALSASAATSPERPTDPTLARLIPDGVLDDEKAAMEFRRFTHESLLERKRTDAEALLAVLDGERHRLDRVGVQRLLAAMNDLRLMLGTRLMVAEDEPFQGDDFSDFAVYTSYLRLGWLQENLIDTLQHPSDDDGP